MLSEGNNSNPSAESDQTGIISGHSHIGIVTTYRNRCWQRIPTLLLAEGDVVALMGGDVTQGRIRIIACGTPSSLPNSMRGGLSSSIDSSVGNRSLMSGSSNSNSLRDSGEILSDINVQSSTHSLSHANGAMASGGGGDGSIRLWRQGRLWSRGDKVPLRTSDAGAADSPHGQGGGAGGGERQRSIAPDSVEHLFIRATSGASSCQKRQFEVH